MMTKIYEDDLVVKFKVESDNLRTSIDSLTGSIETIEFENRRYTIGENVSKIELLDTESNEAVKYGWRYQSVEKPQYVLSFRKKHERRT